MHAAGTDAAPLAFRRQLSAPALLRLSLDAAIAVGSLLAIASYFGEPFQGPYLILALIVFSLTFPGAVYNPRTVIGLARDVLLNWFIVLLILLFFGYASGYLSLFPARMVLAWAVAVPALVFTGHATIPYLLPKVLAIEGMRRTAVIAGGNELGAKLVEQIHGAPLLGIQVAGVFDDRSMERRARLDTIPTLGKLAALADYVKSHRVDLIYITLPMASQPRILNLLNQLRDTTASIYFVPDIFMFDLIQARVDTLTGIPVVAVCETPFYGLNGAIKTLSDYVIALLALIVTGPIMLAIAFLIKTDSPGPVLFRQRRYGLDGREITVYKFRTMTVLEDGGVVRQATKDDKRITRLGRLLRRTSMDELPQFINVLQGRMSVVGPRPHAVAHNETYRKLIDGYMVRHKVKPGLTGWAQVNGLRGETDTVEKMQQRIEYDLAYLRNWSLRLDLMIILKTVLVLFGDRKAY
jgi:putative colanic acid biosysnthesis UDP-glucose lipid carrier transferase